MQSPLAHHLLQISVTERIPEISAGTEQNNLGLVVTPFERCDGTHESSSSQFSEYRRVYRILAFFAIQPPESRKRSSRSPLRCNWSHCASLNESSLHKLSIEGAVETTMA